MTIDLRIDFGKTGDSASRRMDGWGEQEAVCVWTIGRVSELRLPELPADTSLVLEVDAQPWVSLPAVRGQILRIAVNGQHLDSFVLTERSILCCRIEPGIVQPGEPAVLRFELPCFVRPDILGQGMDSRPLGVGVFSVRVRGADVAAAEVVPLDPIRLAPALMSQPGAVRAVYGFGPSGNGVALLAKGWHTAEDGAVWTAARASTLTLPLPPATGSLQVRISLAPLCIMDRLASQRVTILANGHTIGQFRLRNETTLVLHLADELVAGADRLLLAFVMPDALSMADFADSGTGEFAFILDHIALESVPARIPASLHARDDELDALAPVAMSDRFLDTGIDQLPAAIETELGISLREILRRSESLGDTCAFGLAQRKQGIEILGLLRFANTPINALQRGLADDFQAAGIASEISVELAGGDRGEFLVWIKRYGIRWHTFIHHPQSDAERVLKDYVTQLAYLRRKLYEGFRAGRKIYVIARATSRRSRRVLSTVLGARYREAALEPLRLAEVLPVWQDINRYADNPIVYIVPSRPGVRPGTVELLAPGLMRGYVDTRVIRADVDVETWDHSDWLRVAANAWLLGRASRPPAGS